MNEEYGKMEGSIVREHDWDKHIHGHQCHFCGEWVLDGVSTHTGERHYLSDCRPDLVEHEIGPSCTWGKSMPNAHGYNCYAYQDRDTQEWTSSHSHFYKDGPM